MKPPSLTQTALAPLDPGALADSSADAQRRKQHKALGQMIAGGIAGSVGKTITAPLSRLTILYQVSPLLALSSASSSSSSAAAAHHYPSSLSLYSACRRILREEGLWSFWKGNLTSVLHRFPYSAINFTTYESLRDVLVRQMGYEESPQTRLVCGAMAGAVACFACYPLDLVRTRLTVSAPSSSSSGGGAGSSSRGSGTAPSHPIGSAAPRLAGHTGLRIVHTLQQVVRDEGVRGLYRGLLVSLSVSVPNLAIGFSVYGSMKERCLASDNRLLVAHRSTPTGTEASLSPLGCMVSGAISGVLSSLVTFPADTVRRRMQVKGLVKPGGSGSLKESFKIVKAEGPFGLYRGILPELLKVTPMVGVTFMVYEACVRQLEHRLR